MRKLLMGILVIMVAVFVASCDDTETYADQRNRERDSINLYLRYHNVQVISEAQFKQRYEAYQSDPSVVLTDTEKNEYVLFENTGVYMQIIDIGCGEPIKEGETTDVLCRFDEYNLLVSARGDSLQLSNNILDYSYLVEKMTVTNSYGTFTASFDSNQSLMYMVYGTTSVPNGWLEPLTYIKIGRPQTATDRIAHLKLIVPHSEGTQAASSSVYPCLYDITYQRGR